jgi:hypothetical protein
MNQALLVPCRQAGRIVGIGAGQGRVILITESAASDRGLGSEGVH